MKYVGYLLGLLLVSIAFVGCSTLSRQSSPPTSPALPQETEDTLDVQQPATDVEETTSTLNEAKNLEQELSDEDFNNFEEELDEVNW